MIRKSLSRSRRRHGCARFVVALIGCLAATGAGAFDPPTPSVLRLQFPAWPPAPAACFSNYSAPVSFEAIMLHAGIYYIGQDTSWSGYDRVVVEPMPADAYGFNPNALDGNTPPLPCVVYEDAWNQFKPATAGTVVIEAGARLTVPAGVSVEFASGFGLRVGNGYLDAQGTSQKPVTFRGKQWTGIEIGAGTLGATLSHCLITDSTGSTHDNPLAGLRIYSSNTTVSNCRLEKNEAYYGGAVYIESASPRLSDLSVSGNKGYRGGGLYLHNASPTLLRLQVVGNKDSQLGGGLFLTAGSNPRLVNSLISQNSAIGGGGLYIDGSSPELVNSLIVNNSGSSAGGGLLVDGNSSPWLINSVLANNDAWQGGGLYVNNNASAPRLRNSILWGNRIADGGAGAQVFLYTDAVAASFRHSVIEGGRAGFSGSSAQIEYADNLEADPLFKSASAEAGSDGSGDRADWSLQSASTAINAGNNADFPTHSAVLDGNGQTIDYRGAGRVYHGNAALIDIGAFEFPNNPPTLTGGTRTESLTVNENDGAVLLTLCGQRSDLDVHETGVSTTLPAWITALPADGLGTLSQYAAGAPGERLLQAGVAVADAAGRMFYTPANRAVAYTASVVCVARDVVAVDGEEDAERSMSSPDRHTVQLPVQTRNDPPAFSSTPTTSTVMGRAYEFTLRADDADEDHAAGQLVITLRSGPAWLSLDDADPADGQALLTGTPTAAGSYAVRVRVSDPLGAFTDLDFSLDVQAAQELPAAGAGGDTSAEPGAPVVLSGNGPEGDDYAYEWTVTDAAGNVVAVLDGDDVMWTPPAGGTYAAALVIKDADGTVVGEDRINIAAAEGFGNVDEAQRAAPDSQQAALIASAGAATGSGTGGTGGDAAAWQALSAADQASALAELTALDLDSAQRGQMLDAISDLLEQAASGSVTLSAADLNRLLGSLDNLIVDADADTGAIAPEDRLSGAQLSNLLGALTGVLDVVGGPGPALSPVQALKTLEVVNEALTQSGAAPGAGGSLAGGQIGALDQLLGRLAETALDAGLTLSAGGTGSAQVLTSPVDLTAGVPLTLGNGAPGTVQVTVSAATLAEIRQRTGLDSAALGAVANPATGGNGYLVSLLVLGPNGEVLDTLLLENPVVLTLPVTDPGRTEPASVSANSAITTTAVSADADSVSFETNGFGGYVLTSPGGGLGTLPPELNDAAKATRTLEGASSCFGGSAN